MLTEMIASGIMRLGKGWIRVHRPIFLCHNRRLLRIPHRLLLNHFTPSTSSRRLIPRNQACQVCPGIRQRHNYLPTRLLQRLPSSHQACGETLSLALTIPPETSDAGIWKRTGRSRWMIRSKRSGQGRLSMTNTNNQNYMPAKVGYKAVLLPKHMAVSTWLRFCTNSRKFRINGFHAVTIAKGHLRHSLWLHNCLSFSHIFCMPHNLPFTSFVVTIFFSARWTSW